MQPFLLSPCRLGRFARRNVCTSAETEIPYSNDVNQCLYHKFGNHGVPNINLFDFMLLLVDYGKVFCSTVNELQQNSDAFFCCCFVLFCFVFNEEYIPGILTGLK